jgi:catechol 2,3-dioxygenase-like lactoylglutathione lyase family enzyme
VPEFGSVSHVVLAVSDLERSAKWYGEVFNGRMFTENLELFPGHKMTAYIVGPLLISLHHDDRHDSSDRFDEFRVGLDHLSFAASNRAEVEAWEKHLDSLGVEHSRIADVPYGHVLVFRDPDNIQLEFHAQPDADRGPAPDDAPAVRGVSHIAFRVADAKRSADWYRRVFGLGDSLMSVDEPDVALEFFGMTDSGLGLVSGGSTPAGDRFTEFRTGLDHLAYAVPSADELQKWVEHFDAAGVEHSGITDASYGKVLVFRDPDNIQLELFVS